MNELEDRFLRSLDKFMYYKNIHELQLFFQDIGLISNPKEIGFYSCGSGNEIIVNLDETSNFDKFSHVTNGRFIWDLVEYYIHYFKINEHSITTNFPITFKAGVVKKDELRIFEDKIKIVDGSLLNSYLLEDVIFVENFYHYYYNYNKLFDNGQRRTGKSICDVYMKLIDIYINGLEYKHDMKFQYSHEINLCMKIINHSFLGKMISEYYGFNDYSDKSIRVFSKPKNHQSTDVRKNQAGIEIINAIYNFGHRIKIWDFRVPFLDKFNEPIIRPTRKFYEFY